MVFTAKVQWIKSDYGGRQHLPSISLKPCIRFQKYIGEWMQSAWDVEIIDLEIDEHSWESTSKFKLPINAPSEMKGLETGEVIELLDAYRVIGVGKILIVSKNDIS